MVRKGSKSKSRIQKEVETLLEQGTEFLLQASIQHFSAEYYLDLDGSLSQWDLALPFCCDWWACMAECAPHTATKKERERWS